MNNCPFSCPYLVAKRTKQLVAKCKLYDRDLYPVDGAYARAPECLNTDTPLFNKTTCLDVCKYIRPGKPGACTKYNLPIFSMHVGATRTYRDLTGSTKMAAYFRCGACLLSLNGIAGAVEEFAPKDIPEAPAVTVSCLRLDLED